MKLRTLLVILIILMCLYNETYFGMGHLANARRTTVVRKTHNGKLVKKPGIGRIIVVKASKDGNSGGSGGGGKSPDFSDEKIISR